MGDQRIIPMPEATLPVDWRVTSGTIVRHDGVENELTLFPIKKSRRIIAGVSDGDSRISQVNRVLRTAAVKYAPDDYVKYFGKLINSVSGSQPLYRGIIWALEQARLLRLAELAGLEWDKIQPIDTRTQPKPGDANPLRGDLARMVIKCNIGNDSPLKQLLFLISLINGFDNDSDLGEVAKEFKPPSPLPLAKKIVTEINQTPTLMTITRLARYIYKLSQGKGEEGRYKAHVKTGVPDGGLTLGQAAIAPRRVDLDKESDASKVINSTYLASKSSSDFEKLFKMKRDLSTGETLVAAYSGSKNKWGKLGGVNRLNLSPLAGLGILKKQRIRSNEYGAVMRTPHRVTIDQKIFRHKKRERGGTILIDASGSMNLSPKDIVAVLQYSRHVSIAAYAGNDRGGRITILAEKGKCASEHEIENYCEDLPGGNVIDGPALRWLSDQPKPRIWISDGQVTGINDQLAENLIIETSDILAKGRIAWLRNMSQASKLLIHGKIAARFLEDGE